MANNIQKARKSNHRSTNSSRTVHTWLRLGETIGASSRRASGREIGAGLGAIVGGIIAITREISKNK